MRVYLRSDVSTAASTGDEKYKLKFRFTEQDGNMEEYRNDFTSPTKIDLDI